MGRTAFLGLLVLVSASIVLLSMNACRGGNSVTQAKIKHVVIIFQENRSPDNLFHGLPNADIANAGANSLGQTIPLAPIALANSYDLGHRHSDFVLMYDNGKMDGAHLCPHESLCGDGWADPSVCRNRDSALQPPRGTLICSHRRDRVLPDHYTNLTRSSVL